MSKRLIFSIVVIFDSSFRQSNTFEQKLWNENRDVDRSKFKIFPFSQKMNFNEIVMMGFRRYSSEIYWYLRKIDQWKLRSMLVR